METEREYSQGRDTGEVVWMNPRLVEFYEEGEEAYRRLLKGQYAKPLALAKAINWATSYPDAASGLILEMESYYGTTAEE